MAEFTTFLAGLEVVMGIGIHAAELAAPQRVTIGVWLHTDYDPAMLDDDIAAVVDYDFLRREILALAASRHFNLQETLCEAIAGIALTDPRVRTVRVRSCKPDIYPDAAVGCEIERSRPSAGS